MVLGRGLDLQGRADEATPVLVSAALARQFFPQASPIGKQVGPRRLSSPRDWNTVVGVVADVRDFAIQEQPPALLYIPVPDRAVVESFNPTHMSLAIRSSVPPLSLVGAVRSIVRELDPDLPIANVLTMDRILADATARTSFTMLLLLVAAGVALSLATVGIYGVVSYTVSQRTREIGVRIALGAVPGDISALVLKQGSAAVAAGLGVGLLASLLLTRFLGSLLYEVKPADPVTLAAVSGLLLGIAALANYVPARRATKVDPMEALRYE
ncbi:MAG: hypothetical protein HYW06_00280 [Gemmatimonadetes bacterium]|nr:hypothetical protein [Gemmatimonadota bacterium]